MAFKARSEITHGLLSKEESILQLTAQVLAEVENIPIRPEDRDNEGNLLVRPDGPKSLLPENEWKIVRTAAFCSWFGDWRVESKEGVSKIVDKNGEPFRVYHESRYDFAVFDDARIGTSTDEGYYGHGHYFSTNPGLQGTYSGDSQFIILGFLNIKNPFYFSNKSDHNYYYRFILNQPSRENSLAKLEKYFNLPALQQELSELIQGKIDKHTDIPLGVDFETYWENRRIERIELCSRLLQTRGEVIENFDEVFDQAKAQYDGAITSEKQTDFSYSDYEEIVAFRADQILISKKIDNREGRRIRFKVPGNE